MKKIVAVVVLGFGFGLAAQAAPKTPIPLLDAFQECDVAKLTATKLPVALPGGLKAVKIRPMKYGSGHPGVEVTFARATPGLDRKIKQATGYDFTNHDEPSRGQVGFDADGSGERDNYLICYRY